METSNGVSESDEILCAKMIANKIFQLWFFPFILFVLFLSACTNVGRPQVIYIARHGQTGWNRVGRFQGDPDLDPVGYINRISLWRLLKDEPIRAIYSSQLLRTRRTAELVARQNGLTIQPRAELNEINTGIFEGICYEQVFAADKTRSRVEPCAVNVRGSGPKETLEWLKTKAEGSFTNPLVQKPPLGENYHDLVQRISKFIEELDRENPNHAVLVVGHSVTNRLFLHLLAGWPIENVRYLRQENDQVYRLERHDPKSPTLFLYTPGLGWKPCTMPKPGQRGIDCNPGVEKE
ncbi:MAG: histidine phosphatase family protein [Pseudomonadota bacterium]